MFLRRQLIILQGYHFAGFTSYNSGWKILSFSQVIILQVSFSIIFPTNLSFCRFRFITKMWVYHFVGLNSHPYWKTINFVVKLQAMLHQFSTTFNVIAQYISQKTMQYVLLITLKYKPTLIQNSNTKTNGRNQSVVL